MTNPFNPNSQTLQTTTWPDQTFADRYQGAIDGGAKLEALRTQSLRAMTLQNQALMEQPAEPTQAALGLQVDELRAENAALKADIDRLCAIVSRQEMALLVKAAAHATVLEASPESEPTAKPLPATALAAQHGFNVINLRSPRR
jgi:hypothetical protein